MSEWIRVCRLEEIRRLGARVAQTAGADIAVFRTADDAVRRRGRVPPQGRPPVPGHRHGPQGHLPLARLDRRLGTGEACAPDQGCTRKLPVRLEGDKVMLGFACPSD
ncbi:MAG: nitrite reductase (NAD(P)H) small subunit [Comamonadaceae bacterium]|nr:nitrite reductase (NAD(P)H) small subunit [Comamonadaceae bacterium]